MFIDQVEISIKAGNGGNGCVSFHREKFVAFGGPDGGDGGRGGDVSFEASNRLHTLVEFRYKRKFEAQNGQDGRGGKSSGKSAPEMVILVPPGTLVRNAKTNLVIADLTQEGDKKTVLDGGRGGFGNARFATSTRQAPNFAKPGEQTETFNVILELKSIADVGLVGFPNVGKSTILSVMTAATPKIANYHFTTLQPNLGVAAVGEDSFVMADIPGLIEGAHEGLGLGHDFLRHIERTRMIVHVLDISGSEQRDPLEDFEAINRELRAFSAALADRPQIIAANKTDLTGFEDHLERLQARARELGMTVIEVSAATRRGIDQLGYAIVQTLRTLPPVETYEAQETLEAPKREELIVRRGDDGAFELGGTRIEQLVRSVNFDDAQSMGYFQRSLRSNGAIDALRAAGAKEGDTVRLEGMEFDFVE